MKENYKPMGFLRVAYVQKIQITFRWYDDIYKDLDNKLGCITV